MSWITQVQGYTLGHNKVGKELEALESNLEGERTNWGGGAGHGSEKRKERNLVMI